MTVEQSPGVVYLVGAGPGDPGLITVRGRDLLHECDVIVYDALANPLLLGDARAGGRIELIDVGKRGGSRESANQDEINARLIELARAGKRVVRLKGGDPFVFGRGSEEALALAEAGIPFEVVPGVTAGIAAAAYAGIPVTHRGLATSVTFVTGHEDPTKPETQVDWDALARITSTGTVVLYMGVKTLPSIVHAMVAAGLDPDTPAAAVQWGTLPRQHTVVATVRTLAQQVAAEGLSAPVISIFGNPVALRQQIEWFEERPLFGRRIVVTRASALRGTLADALRLHGAEVIEAPATSIEILDSEAMDDVIARIGEYQWLILTSVTGVRIFGEGLARSGLDARALATLEIAVIGPSTATALGEIGLRADLTPPRFVAESLLEAMKQTELSGVKVLIAGAEDTRPLLADGLRAAGADVDVVSTHRSAIVSQGAVVDALREAIEAGVDLVAFTSASGVAGFVAQVGAARATGIGCASIGPVTSEAARAAGITVAVEAKSATIRDLVDAIVGWARR